MKVLVYLKENELSPFGEPRGVGWYYNEEMKRRGEHTLSFLPSAGNGGEKDGRMKKLVKRLPKSLYNLQHNLRDIRKIRKLLDGKLDGCSVDFNEYDVIHFHESQDMFLEKKKLNNYKGIVVYQSHTPLPTGIERCTDLPKIYFSLIPDLEKKLLEVDEYAFRRADYIIFPCEDAEESYLTSWPMFKTIRDNKKGRFRYVLTGIKGATPKRGKEEVRKELGIPLSDFVVVYAGRHNYVKGYDLLKTIGCRFIGKDEHCWMVVAGRPGLIEAPEEKRWLEIGWTTDAHSYIAASDVFLLPNRVTYFDLIMLEILSLGKIVITSRTGGNRFFEKNSVPGVFLYDTEDEALALLEKVRALPEEERTRLGEENRKFFLSNLTAASMYDSYMKVLCDITGEKA